MNYDFIIITISYPYLVHMITASNTVVTDDNTNYFMHKISNTN